MTKISRTPHYTLINLYNINKGYENSISKAVQKALEEEGVKFDRKVLQPFLVYSLLKVFLRFYKWFTNNVFFKRGKTKFIIYSMDVFLHAESKNAWKEIKQELIGVFDEYRKHRI